MEQKNLLTAKPDLKAVFFWIKSFTTNQKRQFTAMYGSTGKSKAGFWKLYQGFLAAEEFDATALQKIISSKNFYRDLDILLEKLIYWSLTSEKDEQPRLYIIQKAIGVGAVKMVKKFVWEELEKCLQWNRFAEALVLLNLAEQLHQIFGVNIRLNNPKPFPSRQQILYHIEELLALENTVKGLDLAFFRRQEEREAYIYWAWGGFRRFKQWERLEMEIPDIRKRIFSASIQARIAILNQDLAASIAHQVEVAALVDSIPQNPIGESLHEANILVHLHALARDRSQARLILEQIRQLKPQNPLEEALQFQFTTKAEMGIAERWWDAESAEKIFEKLMARPDAFSKVDYPMLLFKVALIHFVNGNYKLAIRRLVEVFDLAPDMKKEVLVWAELLELGCHYSLGELDTVDRSLKRCKKVVEGSGSRHASLVFRTLKAISHNKAYGREWEVSEPFRKEFSVGSDDWVGPVENWYFHLTHWLEARRRKMTCKELHEDGDAVWQWNGLDEVDPARSMHRIFYPRPYFGGV